MIINDVKKYAYSSAKFKTRTSKLLSDHFFKGLLQSHSLSDALVQLQATEYTAADDIFRKTSDIKAVEMELRKQEISELLESEKLLPPSARPFLAALSIRYEVDVLKNTLRIWFDKNIRSRDTAGSSVYLYKGKIVHQIPTDRIIECTTTNEIINLLGHTPYGDILSRPLSSLQSVKTLFPVEIELDRYYFRQLLSAADSLKGKDRILTRRLIGIQIDIENLSTLVRFKSFYSVQAKELLSLLIPGGFQMGEKQLTAAFALEDAKTVVTDLTEKIYPEWKHLFASSTGSQKYSTFFLFEELLKQILLKEIARIKTGYPFTIGIFLAYIILKQKELKKIISILNGKFYELPDDQIQGAL